MRHGQVRGAEPFRESAQPRKRPRRDAQGRREPARDREAAQRGAGEPYLISKVTFRFWEIAW